MACTRKMLEGQNNAITASLLLSPLVACAPTQSSEEVIPPDPIDCGIWYCLAECGCKTVQMLLSAPLA